METQFGLTPAGLPATGYVTRRRIHLLGEPYICPSLPENKSASNAALTNLLTNPGAFPA